MSQRIRIFYISLLLVFYSCNTTKELYKESESESYPSDDDLTIKTKPLYNLEDELSFEIELVNATDSDILIPIRYMKPQLLFTDETITPKVIVSPNYAFDKIKFSKLSNKKRLEIIENLCLPYLDEQDYKKLKANESIVFVCKLDNYSNINKQKSYELKVKFQLTDRIQKYCPKFWSGTTESNLFKIEIE